MYNEAPFTDAERLLREGCSWLQDLLLSEGDERCECATDEETLEQVHYYLNRAISVLDESGREQVEVGGINDAAHGWIPNFQQQVIDQAAASAADDIRSLAGEILAASSTNARIIVTADLIYEISSVLATKYGDRLAFEARLELECPEPVGY